MNRNRIEIKLCMGSSCYSRGNDAIKNTIQEFLIANELTNEVDFRGHLCKAHCNHGPNLSIGEKEYSTVSESNIQLILKEVFRGRIKTQPQEEAVEPELCMIIAQLMEEERTSSVSLAKAS